MSIVADPNKKEAQSVSIITRRQEEEFDIIKRLLAQLLVAKQPLGKVDFGV